MQDERIDDRALSRLKWRCRRGLLENDLFLDRFFARYESGLTMRDAEALAQLMTLADNDLLDLFLGRTEPQGELDHAGVRHVLSLLRQAPQAG